MPDSAQGQPPAALFESYNSIAHIIYALLASIAALCLTAAFQPTFRGNHAYWPLWPVVIFAARFWGPASAALAALVGWLGVWYWFIPPSDSFAVTDRSDWVGVVSFAVVATLIILSNLRERKMWQHVRATVRTVSGTMRSLLSAYLDATCSCTDRTRGHDLGCHAHPSAPLVVRAERAIRMLGTMMEANRASTSTKEG